MISCPFQLTSGNILSSLIPELNHCGPFAHALSSSCSCAWEGQAGMWWLARGPLEGAPRAGIALLLCPSALCMDTVLVD